VIKIYKNKEIQILYKNYYFLYLMTQLHILYTE